MVIVRRHVKDLRDLGSTRLNLTQFVDAARLEHAFLSIPLPVQTKPGVRHAMDASPNLSVLPGLAAVHGDFHLADGASTRPRQSRDLVNPAAGQFLSARRKRDD